MILLADDEPLIRSTGEEALRRSGYNVLLAADGREALEILEARRGEIALVVLDLTMPRLSGAQALPKMLERRPDLKVITTSGYTVDDSLGLLATRGEAGPIAFMQKPYSPRDLVETVRSVLDRN